MLSIQRSPSLDYFSVPATVPEMFTRLPNDFRVNRRETEWASINARGRIIDSFLEAPVMHADGRLYVSDIPYGRIFQIDAAGHWELALQYAGEPNGMKFMSPSEAYICDFLHGLVRWDVETNEVSPLIARKNSERFKGLNDLTISSEGDIYFTDQGQTGLHDSTGRVYRYTRGGRLELVLDGVPSPNGLVLSADESVLFLAVTRDNSVWRVPLSKDGTAYKVGRFMTFNGPGGPDGLAMTAKGNLVIATPGVGAVWVVNEFGEVLERHDCRPFGNLPTNIAFDRDDTGRFYITESLTGAILVAQTQY